MRHPDQKLTDTNFVAAIERRPPIGINTHELVRVHGRLPNLLRHAPGLPNLIVRVSRTAFATFVSACRRWRVGPVGALS